MRTSASREGNTIEIIGQILTDDVIGDIHKTIGPGESALGHAFEWWALQIETYEEDIPGTATIILP